MHFNDSFIAWDNKRRCAFVAGEYFGAKNSRRDVGAALEGVDVSFGKLYDLTVQKHGGHFTFLLNNVTLGSLLLGEDVEGGPKSHARSLTRIALKRFGGKYRVYNWCLWAEDNYGGLPFPPPPPAAAGAALGAGSEEEEDRTSPSGS